MKRYTVDEKDQAIAKAQRIVETEDNGGQSRRWLKSFIDPYNHEKYRIELYVLEGSPARGYIVANILSNSGSATAFNIADEPVAQVSWL